MAQTAMRVLARLAGFLRCIQPAHQPLRAAARACYSRSKACKFRRGVQRQEHVAGIQLILRHNTCEILCTFVRC